ncbi:MAG: GH3 auxin-responsive promoter family protein [Paludibacteraceae bacterium]|nr:GH3 auxin-responsive promoter family protein [Paludibacteraceae bacterium]MBQ9296752.1 GH3 auxin-responsive promoter family protein [Paludibacteraceae bacterium]
MASKIKPYLDQQGRALPYPWLINTMLMLVGGSQTIRLRYWSRNPKHAAEKTLRDILTISRNTVYGQEHHFDRILSATSAEDLFRLYRLYVPVNNSFETLRPYVERHKHGEENVLFPGKPDMYATTSGTTSEPKWIPMTHKYLKDVYGKMSHIWTWNFVKHRSRIFGGHIFTTVGKECEGYAPDGTLYGSVSGVLVRDIPQIIKKHYTAPASVMSIPDYAARNYVLMRLALQHRDVTLWATANPSTILELLRSLHENTDEMIHDIETGAICEDFDIPYDIRSELDAYVSPQPERAAELRQILAEKGKLEPKDFWPWLQYLSTWKCGNTKIYMDKYMDQFDWDKTFYQELGYIATECRFGFSLDDTNESVLFPQFHYYEFVEESELDCPNKHFLQIYELEQGKRYCAYVTTYSGLFRYNMNDLIEVGGRYYNTPTVHMVSKVNGIVSMTGEKLYEPQFLDAVHQAEEETGIRTKFFVGFADVEESKYHFYYEFENEKIRQAEAETFTEVVDRKLQQINLEYESKRSSFRLHAPETHILLSNAYARFKAACLKDGFRDGQFKFNLLMQDEKRRTKFNLIQRLETGFERLGDNIINRADIIDERRKNRAKRRKDRRL